jgi:flagellar basal-body rod modification protein FlgD
MEIIPSPSPLPGNRSTNAAASLAEDFDTFLTLLTTQLQHQDPLAPMDSTQFTEQLVLFTGVEQAISTNKHLENLISAVQVNQTTAALGYLGTTVIAEGDTAPLASGVAQWSFTLGAGATSASVSVFNEEGQIVFTGDAPTQQGEQIFQWDGRDNQAVLQPDGIYTISVFAHDAEGFPVDATTLMNGRVTGIETIDGETFLFVNGSIISVGKVLSVNEAPVVEEETPPENGGAA